MSNENYIYRQLGSEKNLNKERANNSIGSIGASAAARQLGANNKNNEERTFPGLLVGEVKWGPGANGYGQESTHVPGLIKVYIPGYCDIQTSQTTGDFGDQLDNLVTCYPMFPLTGSSLNADGQGTSWGFHYVPRVGDFVGVMFIAGNTRDGIYIGSLPQSVAKRGAIPDVPSRKVSGGQTLPSGESPGADGYSVSLTTQTREAGLVADILRGATPPQDKINNNVIGITSYGNPADNTVGHQLAMLDDPSMSMLRLRSGKGGQVIINDAGKFVYVSTQSGGAWMELNDNGSVDVYCKSFSVHATEDANFGVGRDLNIDVGRDINVRVADGVVASVGGSVGITVTGDIREAVSGGIHASAGGTFRVSASDASIASDGKIVLDSGGQLALKGTSVRSSQSITTPTTATTDDPDPPEEVTVAVVPGNPTPEQYREGKSGSGREMVSGRDGNSRYPMHEPWDPARTNIGNGEGEEYSPTGVFKQPPSSGGNPAPYRNNNPGAIMDGGIQWVGMTGTESLPGGNMVTYETPEAGFRAMSLNLNSYGNRGLNTIDEIIGEWSTTDQTAYKNYVSQQTGFGLNQELDMNDFDTRFKLQKAMARFESNGALPWETYWTDEQLASGLSMAKISKETSSDSLGSKVEIGDTQFRIPFAS